MFELVDIPREQIVALGTMQNIWRYQYENELVPRSAATAPTSMSRQQFALFTRADGSQQVRQRPDGPGWNAASCACRTTAAWWWCATSPN